MTPLYMLATDQRLWLKKAVFGTTAITPDQHAELVALKQVVVDGALAAVAGDGPAPERAAVLIDEELGGDAPARISRAGVTLSMALERSQDCVYAEEPRSLDGSLLAAHRPDLPKVLVRYNPADPGADRSQLAALRATAERVHAAGLPFLLELLVPPTAEQLSRTGSAEAFDRDLLPGLTLAAVADIRRAGVHAEWWKVEGMPDVERFEQVLAACRDGAPVPADAIVLGKAAAREQVDRWLRDAAAAGFRGFAIGRSIWWQELQDLRAGRVDRATAVERIAGNYRGYCATMDGALAGRTPA